MFNVFSKVKHSNLFLVLVVHRAISNRFSSRYLSANLQLINTSY